MSKLTRKQINELIEALPKAELHVHLFGTLTPELLFFVAKKNKIKLPYKNEKDLRLAFKFTDLTSFINIYDLGVSVFRTEQDFYDITFNYLKKSYEQNVKYVELIFDPQSHYNYGVRSKVLYTGITRAMDDAFRLWGIKSNLILCFVRHMDLESAQRAFNEVAALPKVVAVGLGGIEKPYPPALFKDLYNQAHRINLKTSAHCGEEADWTYIKDGLDTLNLDRIDHGISCLQNKKLVKELVSKQISITVCPVSNVKIGLFNNLKDHCLKDMLRAGLKVSLHSDDPSYFNAYINDVYKETVKAQKLNLKDLICLIKNSFEGAFISEEDKVIYYNQIDECISNITKEKVNASI